jgi:hypothetical protein
MVSSRAPEFACTSCTDFLQAAHRSVQPAHRVVGLFKQRAHHRVVLRQLRGKVLLSLQQGGDVALQLNDFASHRASRPWSDQAAATPPQLPGNSKRRNITKTHG